MSKEDRKAYMKAYRQAHKDQVKAWKEAHKDQVKAKKKAWYESHIEQAKAKKKAWYEAHKEDSKAYMKAWYESHIEQAKAYMKADVNANGESKHSIRKKSQRILKQMNLKLPGYEIHHCFGYEDPSKFIYISKALHLKIHQFLRDHGIDADSDHWLRIRDIVLHCNEYFYAKI